ncbi:hypothetical protein J5X84_33650 [Streptosporangiaceae bacterium NEAU-GS5]|nr:hypothetical protein [Streptosporangiaceae bacterium NEAU-GS5]
MDFNLGCVNSGGFGDNGAFPATLIYATYSYVFKIGSHGTCWVYLYDRTRGGYVSSPSVTR